MLRRHSHTLASLPPSPPSTPSSFPFSLSHSLTLSLSLRLGTPRSTCHAVSSNFARHRSRGRVSGAPRGAAVPRARTRDPSDDVLGSDVPPPLAHSSREQFARAVRDQGPRTVLTARGVPFGPWRHERSRQRTNAPRGAAVCAERCRARVYTGPPPPAPVCLSE